MKDMVHADLVPQPTVSGRGREAVVLFTLCLGVLITQVDASVVKSRDTVDWRLVRFLDHGAAMGARCL